jgi:hypothetical protein
MVTLEEYFRVSRETDDWITFDPREYPSQTGRDTLPDAISKRVDAYRCDVADAYKRLSLGFTSLARSVGPTVANNQAHARAVLNAWSFPCTRFGGANPLDNSGATVSASASPWFLPDVPGCGFARLHTEPAAAVATIADGRVLRNELLELTVSETTGGIQSLKTYQDRSTRVSQRLVFECGPPPHAFRSVSDPTPKLNSQMIAERVEITHNDALLGEITSQGRLVNLNDQLLARYTQRVRLARGLPAAIVDVQLEPERLPEGELWSSYYASRLAWLDETVSFRRGSQWLAGKAAREQIESPEWVEVAGVSQNMVCFGLGLPFHRKRGLTWLDTLLCVAGESRRRFQFAIGLDCPYPAQSALALLTVASESAQQCFTVSQPRGWFVHLGAKNLIMTHIELLDGERAGIRCRILETEARSVETSLAAYRAFRTAQITDFRGAASEVLSVVDGAAQFDIGPHDWIQLEAEW